MTSPPPDAADAPDAIEASELREARAHFARFAEGHSHLTLYAALCRGLAEDPETASLLLAAQPGQARPVLYLAALHDLVLANPGLPAARWYPSVVGREAVPSGDPWPDVRRTILDHADELRETIATRRTQTNEVNRAVYVATALAFAAADTPTRPIVLVELGASAGLLLQVDRYRIELHRRGVPLVLGAARSPVTCQGEDRSPARLPDLVLPPVVARGGLDVSPVDIDDESAVRWLEACLWPDVPGRVERFRAALALLRRDRPRVWAGDMIDDLRGTAHAVLDQAAVGRSDLHLVVFSSWALTYVKRERRGELADLLAGLAREVPAVSWVTAEPVGAVPGLPTPRDLLSTDDDTTVLGARRWRGGRELPPEIWGTCHPHGEWVAMSGSWLSGIR